MSAAIISPREKNEELRYQRHSGNLLGVQA